MAVEVIAVSVPSVGCDLDETYPGLGVVGDLRGRADLTRASRSVRHPFSGKVEKSKRCFCFCNGAAMSKTWLCASTT
jgi:hypothetical protein